MKHAKIINNLGAVCLLIFCRIGTVDVGSDTMPTRFTTQQTLLNGDRIAGFASLEAGFSIVEASASALFDSFFPVSGEVDFSCAHFILNRDLIFSDVTVIKMLGNISGNGHVLEFSSSVSCIPSLTDAEMDCGVVQADSALELDHIETVDWSFDDKFIAAGLDDNVASHDLIRIYSRENNILTLRTTEPTDTYLQINDVRWHPFDYILAVAREDGGGASDELRVYTYDAGLFTLTEVSSDAVGNDVRALDWHPTGSYLATGSDLDSGEIRLYPVSTTGILDTASVLSVNITPNRNVSEEAMDWDQTGSYLGVGVVSSGSEPQLLIYEFNDQPSLSLVLNASLDAGATVRTLDWNPTCTDLIAIGLLGSSGELLELYEHDALAGTVTKITGIPGIGATVENIHWHPDGDALAIGVDATGEGFRVFCFDKDTRTFEESTLFNFSNEVESVRWSHDGKNIALGNEDPDLVLYRKISEALEDCIILSDVHLVLNCNVDFKNCCLTFTGNSSINGQGNCLTLQSTCTIHVGDSSSLLFKDIELKNISDGQIQCLDSNGTLSFQDVTLVLDDDFTFTKGAFDVIKDLNIVGSGHTFTYQSTDISTIQKCGKFLFDRGVTFSYDPPIANQKLLYLTNDTSAIVLNGATFHTTTTGMLLNQGIFEVKGKSFIYTEGTTEDTGIIFGDSTAGTSVDMRIDPATMLEVLNGCLQLDVM